MTDQNKENLVQFGKVVAFGLPAFIAIITFAGILNGVVANGLDSFYGWIGGLNFCAEAFLLYAWYKKLFKKEDK
jgi:hypothetical protein